jgi:short chain dehydrogenase
MQSTKRVLKSIISPQHQLPLILTRPLVPSYRRMAASAAAMRLDGKTILITGASSGIGRSTAFEFARTSPENLKLILAARRVDSLKDVAAQIQKEVGLGVKVLPVKLDISIPEEVKQFVENLPQDFKDINILVNNASVLLSLHGIAQSLKIGVLGAWPRASQGLLIFPPRISMPCFPLISVDSLT